MRSMALLNQKRNRYMKDFIKLLLLLCAVLSTMSFSCSKKKTLGDPYILFEVHGTVVGKIRVENTETPEEGDYIYVDAPVKGIRVSSGAADAVYTNDEGKFVFYGKQTPSDVVTLVFTDTDDAVNGGPYRKTTANVKLKMRDEGNGGLYLGYWFASGVEVNLILKEDDLESDSGFDSIN